jgi:hypothetical protein
MENIESVNLSEPVFNGMRGSSKIRGGVDTDIAKSAFQKAIRRGDVNLAWMMGLRLNEFLNVGEGVGKPIRSNLINRLPVITGEDIGMANLEVVKKVDEVVNALRENPSLVDPLIEIIALMAESEKSRLGSHVNAVYYQAVSTPEYFDRLNELRPSVLETFKKIESNPEVNDFTIEGVEEEDGFLITRIVWLLKNAETEDEKMATFFYMRHLLNSENKYKIPRGYPKKRNISSAPIFMVWNEMMRSSPEDRKEMIVLLYKQFLEENEPHIYLVLALFVYFFYEEVESKEIDVDAIIEENGGLEKIKEDAMSVDVEIPDYAVDKHTRKGRVQGKDSVVFAIEGARVENESAWMKPWKDLENIYIDFRKFMPKFVPKRKASEIVDIWMGRSSGKSEVVSTKPVKKRVSKKKSTQKTSEIPSVSWDDIVTGEMTKEHREKIMSDDTPRGQLLTSKWKKYVYMPTDEYYVYKGPWKTSDSTEKEQQKLRKLKFRFDVAREMKARVLKGEILMDDEKNVWVRYPTLSNVPSSEWKLHLVHDKISDKVIRVVDRQSLGTLPMAYYASDEKKMDMYLFGKLNLYCHFLLLYVLGVGDTGLYNVLIGDLGPFIIDIDDDTTKTEFTEVWSIFGKRPGDSVVKVLEEGVRKKREKIKACLDNMEEHVEKMVELGEKNGLVIDGKELKGRIENVKNVLLK